MSTIPLILISGIFILVVVGVTLGIVFYVRSRKQPERKVEYEFRQPEEGETP